MPTPAVIALRRQRALDFVRAFKSAAQPKETTLRRKLPFASGEMLTAAQAVQNIRAGIPNAQRAVSTIRAMNVDVFDVTPPWGRGGIQSAGEAIDTLLANNPAYAVHTNIPAVYSAIQLPTAQVLPPQGETSPLVPILAIMAIKALLVS